jgi:hypothetical protein
VTYHFHGGPVSVALPHDIVHYAVEDELGIADGIWGAIAGGVVFSSMTHVSGRRPPHAAERSAELIRTYRQSLQRAELIGGVVERGRRRPARRAVATRGVREPGRRWPRHRGGVARRAAAACRGDAVGGVPGRRQLAFDWPAHRRMRLEPARRTVHRDPASRSRRVRDRASRAGRPARARSPRARRLATPPRPARRGRNRTRSWTPAGPEARSESKIAEKGGAGQPAQAAVVWSSIVALATFLRIDSIVSSADALRVYVSLVATT